MRLHSAQKSTPTVATPTLGATQCSRATEIANFTVSTVFGAINFDANALVLDDSMNEAGVFLALLNGQRLNNLGNQHD